MFLFNLKIGYRIGSSFNNCQKFIFEMQEPLTIQLWDLFFGYSNWPVYSLVIIIILLSNLLNNFENFLLTFVNGHNGDRSPTFGSMNRRSTTRLQHQSLLITVYFSVIAILLPNFVCFQWNKLAICGEAYCYTFWQEKRVYLYAFREHHHIIVRILRT
mgnify:CR=1 FL=1